MSWLTALLPGKIWLYAIAAGVIFTAGGTAAYKFEEMRYAAKENARAQQELADVELAAKAQFRKQDAVITAQNAARAREIRLRADADGARASVGGLRNDLDRAMQAAGASLQACAALNATTGELLAQCADRYTSVAREADAWASDAKMMDEAWPK